MLFTSLFVAFLLADTLLRTWLSLRQVRHVARHRDEVPEPFATRIGLRSHQRAADYTMAKARLTMIERLVETVVLLGFTLLGGLQTLDVFLGNLFDNEMWRQLALLGAVFAIMGVIGLPFAIYNKFRLDQRFGFNRVTPRLFVIDCIKTLFLSLLFGTPLAAAVLWIMGNTGSNWAWLAWGIWVLFNILLIWLFPTVIAPAFNKFEPLDKPEIIDRIQRLMTRCGFSAKGLYVMDGSKRSAHGNAYFTGFGNARRIVFFDTLLSRLNGEEIEAVLAHELGHFKHHHIMRRMLLSFGFALIFFHLLAWLSGQVWFYEGLGVIPQLGRPNDALALILFFLAMPVFTFWVTPLAAWLSRRDEFQADRYASEQASRDALISALVKLYDDNAATLTPDPLHSAFYDSHPPAVRRIAHLNHVAT